MVKILDQLTRIEAFPRLADNWEEDTWGISVSVRQQHFVFSIPSDSPQNVINFNVLNLNDDALRVESLNMFNLTQRVIFQNKKVDQKHFGITLPASISFLTLYSLHIQHTNIRLKYKPWCGGLWDVMTVLSELSKWQVVCCVDHYSCFYSHCSITTASTTVSTVHQPRSWTV